MHQSAKLTSPLPFIAAIAAAMLLCSSCADKPTQPPYVPRFSFPTSPGTQWIYNYNYHYHYVMTGEAEDRTGKRVWQIVSVTSTADTTACVIQCTAQDTIHLWALFPHPLFGTLRDSTYIVHSISSFPVVISSETIVASWQGTVDIVREDPLAPVRFSRILANPSDTLRLEEEYASAFYLSGIGLVKYSGKVIANHFRSEELTLVSAFIK